MRVLQLIDSLEAGGAERVAVNLANLLVDKLDFSGLCATRGEGGLKKSLHSNVNYLFLDKKSKLDIRAIRKLALFVKKNNIEIIHAHSTSFFYAVIVKKIFITSVKVVWHDHYGASEYLLKRKSFFLRFFSSSFSHIIAVNNKLKQWSISKLNCDKVSYIPNFAVASNLKSNTKLEGNHGCRVVCLANLRPQKDHITLLKAFGEVVKSFPKWSLHLVGKDFEDDYSMSIKEKIKNNGLSNNVYVYGSRLDVSNILSQASIGVLSSKSEGLPLALLEYGLAGLAVVVTDVGECSLVIGESPKNGITIPEENPEQLKLAILELINNNVLRKQMGSSFYCRVNNKFSSEANILEIIKIYKTL